MAALRLFAQAREAAGTGRARVDGATVEEVLANAVALFGPEFAAVLAKSRVWRNGEQCDLSEPASESDEVAVLPPVSGG